MRMHAFHRTELLLGQAGYKNLQDASICVVGLGGVGSAAAESLIRSGVGHLTLVDFDDVCLTNLNRQVHATRSTVGKSKAELMGARAKDIHRKADVRVLDLFYGPETRDQVLDRRYDFVLDCIDNMTAKVDLLTSCVARGLPVISAMGAGGRLDPTRVRITDISRTKNDPFARIARDLLRQEGIESGIMAVWTDEQPNDLDAAVQAGFRCICPDKMNSPNQCDKRLQVQGSVAWMPAMFGMTMAAKVVTSLSGHEIQSGEVGKLPRQAPSRNKPSAERKRQLLKAAGFVRMPKEEPSHGG